MTITDVDGKIVYANVAAERQTGYSRFEMQGKTPSLWGGQMGHAFYETLWDTIRLHKKVFEERITNKRKDGTLYDSILRIAPILDKKKQVRYFVSVEKLIGKAGPHSL